MAHRYFLVLAACLIMPTGPDAAAQSRPGTISGRVVGAGSNNALPGANVILSGEALRRNRGVATSERGQFTFSNVPTGSYTIRVSYIGYQPQTREVTVESGKTVTTDISLSSRTVRGEEVVVFGSRAEGQSKAFSQQKNAVNVKNIIAADQMGRFPDVSAPAALQRVPGINVQRDQGEARYVQIRGAEAGMTKVSFNGVSVPSPEGEERQVAMDMIPIEILGSIEVNKAITPDMEAEATGGAVNLETKRPPSAPVFSIAGGGGFNNLRETGTGKTSLSYGNQFGDVGLLVSGSFNRRRFGSDDLEAEYSLSENPSEDQVAEAEQRRYDITRRRSGATAFFDYNLGTDSRIFFHGVFTELLDDEYQPNLISIPEDSAIEFEIAPRVETARTFNLRGGGEHLLGNGVNLEYNVGWARSEEDTPTENTLLFTREGVSFSSSVDGPRIEPSTVEGLTFDELEVEEKHVANTDIIGQFDVGVPYTIGGASGRFKFGGKVRNKNADQSVDIFVYGLADGAGDIMLSDVGSPFAVDSYEPGSSFIFPNRTLFSGAVNSFTDNFGSQLASEKDLEGDTEDYDILERVTAGYAMTELDVTNRLLVVPGVRFEHTTLDTDGNSFDAEAEELTPVSEENDYSNVFPMLHLRYRIGEDVNLRGAVTRTLERPNYFFLVPFAIREPGEVERGNPNLDPMTSVNYDLMAEHFSETVGVVSAGFFAKQLTDPIFTSVDIRSDGTEVLQPRNADSGHIIGLEVNLQRQLTFLPGPLDGLSFLGNYTYTDSEATLSSGREVRLPGQTDVNWNLALGYEKHGFSSRISLNYSGDYIEELGDSQLSTFFVDDHFQVDLSASYQFTPHLSTTVDLVNLNNEPFVRYQGRPSRRAQQEFYSWWGRLTVRYDL